MIHPKFQLYSKLLNNFLKKKLNMKINDDEADAIGVTIQGTVIKVENNIEDLIIK